MGAEPLDYAAIIADLEAKKAALEQTIASLRSAAALGALGQAGDAYVVPSTNVPSITGGEVPVGAFLGKSIPEAAKLSLAILKKKLTSREIAEQLKKGGIESTSKTFNGIVHSILIRASKSGTGIVKLDRSHWGLAEWYPAAMRSTGAPEKRSAAKPKRNKGRKARKHEDKPAEEKGPEERVIQLLRSKPGAEFSAQDIAAPLGIRIQTVSLILGKLVAKKRGVEKTGAGKYRAVAA